MARVSTYLNFARSAEEAFTFYKSVFKTEFATPVMRFGDGPPCPGQPPLADADKKLVMHVALPILGGHMLLGSDCPESMGHKLNVGNNIYLNLEPDTRAETDRLFAALSQGGTVEMALQDMFWGAYWGCAVDRFGVKWMFNCMEKK
jgi:PhnB protein